MPSFGDYTTINDVRAIYLGSTRTADDALILSFVQQASREIEGISKRTFYPTVETRYFNSPGGAYVRPYTNSALELMCDILLDKDLIELLSVTNGDGTSVDITKLILYELNAPSKRRIRLLPTDGVWKNASNGYPDKAISVTGIWGSIFDLTAGWQQVDSLSVGISSSVTTITAHSSVIYAGSLIKIDTEFMYVMPAGDPATTSNSITVVRGVNGSVAASHLEDAVIYVWFPGFDISAIARSAATAYYHLKANPLSTSYTLDGVNFSTPKDVTDYIRNKLAVLGKLRIGIG